MVTGHHEGDGEESDAEAVCGARHGTRHHQTVLPRQRQRPQENLPGQER